MLNRKIVKKLKRKALSLWNYYLEIALDDEIGIFSKGILDFANFFIT